MRERQFRRCDRIAPRRIHDHDAVVRRSGNIDVIHAHSGPANRLQQGSVFQHFLGNLGIAANDDPRDLGSVLHELRRPLVFGQFEYLNYLETLLAFEEVHSNRRDFVCY